MEGGVECLRDEERGLLQRMGEDHERDRRAPASQPLVSRPLQVERRRDGQVNKVDRTAAVHRLRKVQHVFSAPAVPRAYQRTVPVSYKGLAHAPSSTVMA